MRRFSVGQRKRFNYVHAAFGNGITGRLIYADQVSQYEIWAVVFFGDFFPPSL